MGVEVNIREWLNVISIERIRRVGFYYSADIRSKGCRISPWFQAHVGVEATPLPVGVWIPAAFKRDDDFECEMGVCWYILQNTGDLVVCSAIDVHTNDFSHRILVTEIFLCSRLCQDDGVNLFQGFLFSTCDKGKVENVKELLVYPYQFRFIKFLIAILKQVETATVGHHPGAGLNIGQLCSKCFDQGRRCGGIWDCGSIGIHKIFNNPVNVCVTCMELVEAELMLDIEHDACKAREADGKAGDIYQRRKLILDKISTCYNHP